MPKAQRKVNSDFTIINNAYLRDKTISNSAKGTLTVMLSKSEVWNFSVRGLATESTDGKQSVQTDLNMLEEHGYLMRETITDEKGRFVDTLYAYSAENLSCRRPEERNAVSVLLSAVRHGGTHTRRRFSGKQCIHIPALAAVVHLQLTVMITGNTALMPATFKTDSRHMMSMTNEQFQAELAYQTARQMADHFQKCGLLTDEEFTQIDTILITKYRPLFGILFVDLISVQS